MPGARLSARATSLLRSRLHLQWGAADHDVGHSLVGSRLLSAPGISWGACDLARPPGRPHSSGQCVCTDSGLRRMPLLPFPARRMPPDATSHPERPWAHEPASAPVAPPGPAEQRQPSESVD